MNYHIPHDKSLDSITLRLGLDYRDIPKGFMSALEFRQVVGPIDPADIAWAKETVEAIKVAEHLSEHTKEDEQ